MASAEQPPGRWRRRAWMVLAALLPLIVWLAAFRTFAVRSDSMEPAVLTGDHLLVVRDLLDPRPLTRWDVAVFDASVDAEVPEEFGALVKRVAGLPDEWVAVRDGDLWAGPGRDELRPASRPPELVAAMLIPVHTGDGLRRPWSGSPRARLEGGAVATFDAVVRDGDGLDGGSVAVRDTALEVEVLGGRGHLVLTLREDVHVFRARLALAPGRGVELQHNLEVGPVAVDPERPGLEPGSRVLLWNVDDRLRLAVDGDEVLVHAVPGRPPGRLVHNAPELAVEGGFVELGRVTVLRDVHYGTQGSYGTRPEAGLSPCRVPPGHVFLLGDRSSVSRDSRQVGPISLEGLIGRPVARYLPLERLAWLGASLATP